MSRCRKKLLQFIYQRGRCCWCAAYMRFAAHRADASMASWEHIIPRARGGSNSRQNRVLAHVRCNRARGTKEAVPLFKPFPRNWRGPSGVPA